MRVHGALVGQRQRFPLPRLDIGRRALAGLDHAGVAPEEPQGQPTRLLGVGRDRGELAGRELLTAEEVANLEEALESLVGSECETLTSCR